MAVATTAKATIAAAMVARATDHLMIMEATTAPTMVQEVWAAAWAAFPDKADTAAAMAREEAIMVTTAAAATRKTMAVAARAAMAQA